jgi:hypothetical protein
MERGPTQPKTAGADTPATVFEKNLKGHKLATIHSLVELDPEKAVKEGKGIYETKPLSPTALTQDKPIIPEDITQEVKNFINKLKHEYKGKIRVSDIEGIFATDVLGIANPKSKISPEPLNDFQHAHELKLYLVLRELEKALVNMDLYRACFCCISICDSYRKIKTIPFDKAVAQMNSRNSGAIKKKKKIPTDIVQIKKIYDFYNNEKNTYIKNNGTKSGSSKYALISTSDKFDIKSTSIKKILSSYKKCNQKDNTFYHFE